jgi:hypothetical protein
VKKRTPREQLRALREAQLKLLQAEIEKASAEAENTVRALSDPDLSPDQRLDIFKKLQAWPRIVLGLYRAELALAQKDRKDNGTPEYGSEEPSEIALRIVGDAVGFLGPDRIHDLCREGRRHEREGMPQQGTVTVAQFEEVLSGHVPESSAAVYKELIAAYRELFSLRKEQWLANAKGRFSAGRPLF